MIFFFFDISSASAFTFSACSSVAKIAALANSDFAVIDFNTADFTT